MGGEMTPIQRRKMLKSEEDEEGKIKL